MACCTPTANISQSTDPTRTYSIRQDFLREIARRFKRIRGKIRQKIGYQNDALHLMEDAPGGLYTANAEKDRFEFTTRGDLVRKFLNWLQDQLDQEVLEPVPGVAVDRLRNNPRKEVVEPWSHWTSPYLRAASEQGWMMARTRLMQAGVQVGPQVDTIINIGVSRRQLARAYARAYEGLKDITDDMAQQLREEVALSIAQGENPREAARRINNEVESITNVRAKTLARTEILHSHNEQALTRYEQASVDTVAHGEWQTSGLSNVCSFCRRLGGEAFTVHEMRNTHVEFRGQVYRLSPPSHPNGVCTTLPALGIKTGELKPLSERVPGTVLSS